jgi:Ca2+-binding EF-hand superfamily protein
MIISSSLKTSLLDYLDGTADATSESTTSVLPEGTYTKLAASKFIKDNDTDHDGVLSQDEVSISAAAYAKLDADSDGKVTLAEVQDSLDGQDDAIYQFYSNGGAKSSTDITSALLNGSNASTASTTSYSSLAAERFLSDKDADDDGEVDLEESGLSASVFNNIDSDADGSLTESELKTALSGQSSTISKYYKNGGTSSLVDLTSRILKTI